ncbi:RAB7A-interacting MON1-CCZ1 complex subunit 1 isoform X3 [Pezoporus flaviventris]|uniref:RAB7A-interacting MON1-CCZ1 complex subunit 1 isoform X3 n=1 Tax=Pezoporus flaviventris TaxID=889875 RepID=UPI002AB256E0|nr:RAB7A-interacting MON1-CCZ1 complex subunit 1 isoform X3 [Pezoporus flaviventris]
MGEPGCAEALGAVSALWPRLAALGRRLAASGGAGSDDTFLAKGSATLDKLKDFRNEGKEHPSTLLQLYTQVAVLDITYFEENQLVDEDFPEECSLQKVKELTCILSEPEVLVRECSINEECLNDGVHYLMKMLSFRCPLQLYEDVSLQDKDSARLLSEGVFSDTHLLAMMYSGEMCYWGLQHCGEGKQESLETTDPVSNSDLGCRSKVWLDFRETGKKMLEKYVAACEGPLKGQGWNTAAAKQMLCYLMKPRN